jgi:cytochrome c biogenesis protein CcdA
VNEFILGAASAFWLGLLTSISPCPLASNIAAVSFLGRQVESRASVLGCGLFYTLGRTITYVALAVLVVAGLLSIPHASRFLQQFMNRFLGPVLMLVGLLLLDVVQLSLPGPGRLVERLQRRLNTGGMLGAIPLGALFALSFCPVSAALFFGSLMPLALRLESPVLLPALYGAGTAIPVVVFAFFIAAGAGFVGKLFDRLALVERWARRTTALVFILIGLYMTLVFTLEIL